MLLALAANRIENPPEAAWQTLIDVAYAPAADYKLTFDGAFPTESAISSDGQTLVVGTSIGEVLMYDTETNNLLKTFAGHLSMA